MDANSQDLHSGAGRHHLPPHSSVDRRTCPTADEVGGEASLKLPDLSQVTFLGIDGHKLLLFGFCSACSAWCSA